MHYYFESNPYSEESLRVRNIRSKVHGIYQPISQDEWLHMVRVAEYAQSYSEMAVALCHDVVEDGHIDLLNLLDWGLTTTEMHAVNMLCRLENETYSDYIAQIIDHYQQDGWEAGKIAIRVKFYDLVDHIHPANVGNIDTSKVLRYTKAIEQIATALAKDGHCETPTPERSGTTPPGISR